MKAQRILVGFDGSEAAQAALDEAALVAQREHGCLTIVLVLNAPWWTGASFSASTAAAAALEYQRSSIAALQRAVDALPADVSVVSLVAHGRVPAALACVAERYGCDAIVIGRRSGLWSHATGGLARSLRLRTSLPVLAVPAEQPTVVPAVRRGRRPGAYDWRVVTGGGPSDGAWSPGAP